VEDHNGMENDPLNRVKDEAPTPERLTQSLELRKQMEQALAALLSDAERTAFVMRHWEGCGIEEIAGVLKSSYKRNEKHRLSSGAQTAACIANPLWKQDAGPRDGN